MKKCSISLSKLESRPLRDLIAESVCDLAAIAISRSLRSVFPSFPFGSLRSSQQGGTAPDIRKRPDRPLKPARATRYRNSVSKMVCFVNQNIWVLHALARLGFAVKQVFWVTNLHRARRTIVRTPF